MKKVLVTGATGFIGNYVIGQLLNDNCSVIATSSSTEKAAKYDWFNKVSYVEFNLKDFDDQNNYYEFFEKPDLMIHLAWEGLPNYKAAFHIEENLPRHFAFIKNLVQNGLTDITVSGTCFEYGMKTGCLKEDIVCEPTLAYPIAKNNLRMQLEKLQEQTGFQLKWVRLFYMYGKGQSPNSLFSQLDKALKNKDASFNMSGGEQVRDYLPVEKVAALITSIALQNAIIGIINCCSGKPVTVKQIVENYLAENNSSIKLNLGFYPYPDYEPMEFWGDKNKLNIILNLR